MLQSYCKLFWIPHWKANLQEIQREQQVLPIPVGHKLLIDCLGYNGMSSRVPADLTATEDHIDTVNQPSIHA